MFDFTIIELISLTASNSLAVFCLCNLIIAIILVGSSKTSSQFGEKHNAFPMDENVKEYRVAGSSKPNSQFHEEKPYDYDNAHTYTVSSCEKTNALTDEKEQEKVSSVSIDMTDEEESLDDEDEDDQLRKRVEEFIEKINTSWRAEKLNAYSLKPLTYH